jgi:hypothetical protein
MFRSVCVELLDRGDPGFERARGPDGLCGREATYLIRSPTDGCLFPILQLESDQEGLGPSLLERPR